MKLKRVHADLLKHTNEEKDIHFSKAFFLIIDEICKEETMKNTTIRHGNCSVSTQKNGYKILEMFKNNVLANRTQITAKLNYSHKSSTILCRCCTKLFYGGYNKFRVQ